MAAVVVVINVRMTSHDGSSTSASFFIDRGKLASVSHDGTCKMWDTSTEEILKTIDLHESVFSVAWACDWVRDTQRGQAFAMGQPCCGLATATAVTCRIPSTCAIGRQERLGEG